MKTTTPKLIAIVDTFKLCPPMHAGLHDGSKEIKIGSSCSARCWGSNSGAWRSWYRKPMKQYYNVEFVPILTGESEPMRVLVHDSIQHIFSERELSVSAVTMARIKAIEAGRKGEWYALPPTPYHPRIVWHRN